MDQCINKPKFDFQTQFNILRKHGLMRLLQANFSCPESKQSVAATVGEIRINSWREDKRVLLNDTVQTWLESNDWGSLVAITTRSCSRLAAIEFCPGEFQSNGYRKIYWDGRSSIDEVIMALETWLTSVEVEA